MNWKFLKSFIFTSLICIFTALSLIEYSYAQSNNDDIEVYLGFRYQGVIDAVIISYYKNDQFFLPINELFTLLQIESEQNGLIVEGTFSGDFSSYKFDFEKQTAEIGNRTINLTQEDFILKELDSYITEELFAELFQLNFSVNFNSLNLLLQTDQIIPAVERAKRNKTRRVSAIEGVEEEYYPLKNDRDRKFLSGGFMDYSISGNKNPEDYSLNINSSIGLQLAGGSVQGSIFSNNSEESSSFRTFNLRWLYGFTDGGLISKITLGQSNLSGVASEPFTGIKITNEPLQFRRFFEDYEIQGNTFPDSEIELYLNNRLVDYQLADGNGRYRFLTPLFYGSNQMDLKIYGPSGQQIERNSRIQVPFTFLPKGEVNYTLDIGQLDNPFLGSTTKDYVTQANATVGLTNWLTSKIGVDYYYNENEQGNNVPYLSSRLSARVLKNYIVNVEGVTNAFYRSNLSAIFPNSSSFSFDYTNFFANSRIFNNSDNSRQIITSAFYPFKLLGLSFDVRGSGFFRFREDNTFNSYRFNIGTRLRSIRLQIAHSDRLINDYNPFAFSNSSLIESSITYTVPRRRSTPKALRGLFLRGQMNYLPSFSEVESVEFLASRTLFENGRAQLSFGKNYNNGFSSVRFSLILDFNKARTNTIVNTFRGKYNYTQSVSGSIAYDPNYKNFLFTSRNQVGRSGAAVKLFVDNNGNNTFDEEDDLIPDGTINIGRSGSSTTTKNGVLYYTQLQSFFKYNMEMNKTSIKNPMLVPELEQFSIITDPNTFKKIEIPFYMSGVIEGLVERRRSETELQGIGGLKVVLNSKTKEFSKELRTFSDGSFYDYEIPPGEYELFVDPNQLEILNVSSSPEKIDFVVNAIPDGDFVEGLKIILTPNSLEAEEPIDSILFEPLTDISIEDFPLEIMQNPEIIALERVLNVNVENALRKLILAQNSFYQKDFESALNNINQSLEFFKTAQAYALKGSIQYFNGNRVEAVKSWEMALRYDPDIYIPTLEELDQRVTVSSSD
ncbi:MAG: hypothetical protein BalsKO_08570 [Balneolaceae bacterium]